MALAAHRELKYYGGVIVSSHELSGVMLPAQFRFFAFVVLCVGIVASSFFGATFWGPIWGIILPLPLLGLTFMLRWLFFPRFAGKTRVQLASLSAICLPALLYIPSNPLAPLLVAWVAQTLELEEPVETLWVVLGIQTILTLGVIGLNWLWQRSEVSQAPENLALNPALASADKDYTESLKRYCKALKDSLDRYDKDVNWSNNDLIPLEAEVETERKGRLRPRVVADLVAAIRRDRRSERFIVLGDPGSGKSVSLRRLVRTLCEQARPTGVVPVYANLREWNPTFGEVTPESLVEFVKDRALEQTGRDGRAFLETWYEQFRKTGRLFLIIDSFDELPAILDCDDRSDIHKQVSAAFDRFFTQEVSSCRAVLSSRHFRAPVGVKGTRLMIRPFKESQIRRAMKTWLLAKGIDTKRYIYRLFRERSQLIPLLRNPFTAELIAEYARSHGATDLPGNMFVVFDSYITERLTKDQGTLRRYGVSIEEVRQAAGQIAYRMYEDKTSGLEEDTDYIERILGIPNSAEIVNALRATRIARVGGYNQRRFSFVHRRFAEFFVVDHIRVNRLDVDFKSIPTDSRWRDCLVMYCGIAELAERQRIAEYCWSVIESLKDDFLDSNLDKIYPAIHCLQFLKDAYRTDVNSLASFQERLGRFIISTLSVSIYENYFLVAKLSVEVVSILDKNSQEKVILLAFVSEVSWLFDTAFGACQHIACVSQGTELMIRKRIKGLSVMRLLKDFRELSFSLSLSDALRRQRYFLVADYWNLIVILVTSILIFPVFVLGVTKVILAFFVSIPFGFFVLYSGMNFLFDTLSLNSSKVSFLEYFFDNCKEYLRIKPILLYVIFWNTISLAFPGLDKLLKSKEIDLGYLYKNSYLYYYSGKISFVMMLETVIIIFLLFAVLGWEKVWSFSKLLISRENYRLFFSILCEALVELSKKIFQFNETCDLFKKITSKKYYKDLLEYSCALYRNALGLSFWNYLFVVFLLFFSLVTSILMIDFIEYMYRFLLEHLEQEKLDFLLSAFAVFTSAIALTYSLVSAIKKGIKSISTLLEISLFQISLSFQYISDSLSYFYSAREIYRNGFPDSVSPSNIYNDCLSLRKSSLQKLYLRKLRERYIPLRKGVQIPSPPQELLEDPGVAEEIARLQEQWYGLSS